MVDARQSDLIEAVNVLRAAHAAVPDADNMGLLWDDAKAATARGYYDPVEDDRLRVVYARYLGMRVAIWEMILTLKPFFKTPQSPNQALSQSEAQAFLVAFCGAELLVQTGEYLIDAARARQLVWQKLDEAEPRYGIEKKSFTALYRSLTSIRLMRWFYQARDYYDAHDTALVTHLTGPVLSPIAEILTSLNLPTATRGDHLKRYMRFVKFSLRRRRLSTVHKIMFALFETTGSDIAEMKIPLVKMPHEGKRVSEAVITALLPQLRPGDVFVTRHDDAMSNLFLPGYWPHAALYIGTPQDRAELGLPRVSDGQTLSDTTVNMLESKKDGVLLRGIHETLSVDAFVVLRPKLAKKDLAQALTRGLSHAGKLYDFVFDFNRADRLVCTEVIYRTYHGVGSIAFTLSQKAGRNCLSAEDLINQALGDNAFSLVGIYGVGGNKWITGPKAHKRLSHSFASTFDKSDKTHQKSRPA